LAHSWRKLAKKAPYGSRPGTISLCDGTGRCGRGDFGGAVSERRVEKSRNTKGVLEMVEECGKIVPESMSSSVHDVNLAKFASRTRKERAEQQYKCRSHAKEEKETNRREKSCKGLIKVAQKAQMKESTKQHLSLANYRLYTDLQV
jgi:hypothetical protein